MKVYLIEVCSWYGVEVYYQVDLRTEEIAARARAEVMLQDALTANSRAGQSKALVEVKIVAINGEEIKF